MEIQKNSRQIPKTKEICSNKKYSDVVYGWFQDMSERDLDTNLRYVYGFKVNYSKIAKRVNLSRQTVSKRVANLIEMGLLYKNEALDRYEITPLVNLDASLIPQRTLTFLLDSQSENTISIYVYLLNRYWANEEKPYTFTLNSVKDFMGMTIATPSNNHCIVNPMISLKNNGLLDFELVEDGYKTIYRVNSMSFNVKERC